MNQPGEAAMIVRRRRKVSTAIADAALITAGAIGGLGTGMFLGFLIWTLI